MYYLQGVKDTKKPAPELYNIVATIRWCSCPEVIFQGPFVGVLQDQIVRVILDKAAVKSYNAHILPSIPQLPKSADFVIVVFLGIPGTIRLEYEDVQLLVFRVLF